VSKKSFNNKVNYPASSMFVGIDIAKERHCARAIDGKSGKETKAFFFGNDRNGFEELRQQLGIWLNQFKCAVTVIGMEPTAGYWKPLWKYLEESGFDVRVVSSLKVKRSKDLKDNSPLKSDAKDCLLIAKLVQDGNILDIRKGNKEAEEVKTLLRLAEDLDKTAGVYCNRLEYFLSVHFPELSTILSDLKSVTLRKLLKKYPFPQDMVCAGYKAVLDYLMEVSNGRINVVKAQNLYDTACKSVAVAGGETELFQLNAILDMLEAALSRLSLVKKSLEEKLKDIEDYEIFKSVKGIGVMTSAAVIAALGDLRKYNSNRQVLKKVGLNLYRFSSGKHRGVDRISRRGMALLRRYLFMAALINCRPGSIFYEKYRSMIDRGVAKKKAIIAVMRKLLKLLHALSRDGRKFDADYASSGSKSDVIVIKRAAA